MVSDSKEETAVEHTTQDALRAEASPDETADLHPELVAEIKRRQASGEKPIPAHQVWKDLGL